jgi:hemoglobin
MSKSSERLASDVITEAMLRDVVHAFYARVLTDPDIGLLFAGRLSGHWQIHIDHLIACWMAATDPGALPTGWPQVPHASLGLTDGQIDRWFALLRTTINDICPPDVAAILLDRVMVIGASFRAGLGLGSVLRHSAGSQA